MNIHTANLRRKRRARLDRAWRHYLLWQACWNRLTEKLKHEYPRG